MARSKIIINAGAVARLPGVQGVRDDMRRRGGKVLGKAQDDAPVDEGEYRDGLRLEDFEDGVRVIGSSDHDIYVEAETGNLARALDAAAD